MRLAHYILKKVGWKFLVKIPPTPRCLICVAPHTSNWDFIVGELCIRAVGMKVGFLMKSTWFFFPLGCIMRSIGGIPVIRSKRSPLPAAQQESQPSPSMQGGNQRSHVTETVVEEFAKRDNLAIAVTPEGTRSPNPHWHQGLLYMAAAARVPIVLAYIDYRNKVACIDRIFTPTGDNDADMLSLKRYYLQYAQAARFPEHFTTGL